MLRSVTILYLGYGHRVNFEHLPLGETQQLSSGSTDLQIDSCIFNLIHHCQQSTCECVPKGPLQQILTRLGLARHRARMGIVNKPPTLAILTSTIHTIPGTLLTFSTFQRLPTSFSSSSSTLDIVIPILDNPFLKLFKTSLLLLPLSYTILESCSITPKRRQHPSRWTCRRPRSLDTAWLIKPSKIPATKNDP